MAGLLDLLGFNGPVQTQGGEATGPVGGWGGLLGQLGSRLRDASPELMGFGMGMLSGSNQQEGFANALAGMNANARTAMLQRQQDQAQKEKAARMAAAADYMKRNPALAQKYGSLLADPDTAASFAKTDFAESLDPNKKRLQAAQADYWTQKAKDAANPASDETFGVQPIWGTDPATGKPALVQVGNRGTVKRAQIPDGVDISGGVEAKDLGTSIAYYDKRTGALIRTEPKDVAGAAAQKAEGTAQGNISSQLPQTELAAKWATKNIDDLLAHPGMTSATGWKSFTQMIPNTDAYNFKQRVGQLQGRAFLDAYAQMRGTGSVSEAEGKKAEAAQARLNSAQSKEDFEGALKEMKEVIADGLEAKRQEAKGNFNYKPEGALPPKGAGGAPSPKAGKTSSGLSWGVVD